MAKFAIIPDTACDLTKDLREKYGIEDYLHGVLIYPDGSEHLADLDWENMSADEFFGSMKGGKTIYNTATPKEGEVREVFEKHLKAGEDILNICLSSGLSGIYQMHSRIAEELSAKYPERKIIVVDSLRYSTSLALVVIDACKARAEGKTIEETAALVEETKKTVHQMGSMTDMFFLVKKGRVSNFKAFFGQLVGMNLMADFSDVNGMSEVIGRVKGPKDAMKASVEYMKIIGRDLKDQTIFVAHSNRRPTAELLKSLIEEEIGPKEVIINDVGQACGANIGPGLCAAYFHGAPVSEGLKDEREAMAKIIEGLKKK